MRGLDYSAGRIDGHTIKNAGYDFVIRYVDNPSVGLNSKHITPDEYKNLVAAGVTVYLVFEVGTTDALGGFSAGVTNAHRARAGADWIGYPAGGLIFFASDRHLTAAEVPQGLAYLDGAASVLGRGAVGCYGFNELINAAIAQSKASAYWQCGVRPTGADPVQVWQENTGTAVIGGIQCDIDDLLRPILTNGADDLQLSDTFTTQYGQTLSVGDFMKWADYRINELYAHNLGGQQPSRIPGDQNQTDGFDAAMDTVARVTLLKAEFEALAPTLATANEVSDLSAKVDALSATLANVQTPSIDMDTLAAKVAAHLAASVSFTAK